MTTIDTIYNELKALGDEKKSAGLARFFKTGKGEYGEGDRFLGLSVPQVRSVVKRHTDLTLAEIEELLMSPWHEMRQCALFILVAQCGKKATAEHRKAVYDFYLAHTRWVNNWDLVDLSAPYIVGEYLIDKSREPLYRLAESPSLWENRIAVVATYALIRRGDTADIYALALKLMGHNRDLMHKAIGWMLREAGKRDANELFSFVETHRHDMPRTMLRYAIERFTPEERKYLMS